MTSGSNYPVRKVLKYSTPNWKLGEIREEIAQTGRGFALGLPKTHDLSSAILRLPLLSRGPTPPAIEDAKEPVWR